MPNMEMAQCPFYIRHQKSRHPWQNTVTCETIRETGFEVRNMLRFLEQGELEAWMELFCESTDYQNCPYFQAIYKKYEEEKS